MPLPCGAQSGLELCPTGTGQPAPALGPLARPAKGPELSHEHWNPRGQALHPQKPSCPLTAAGSMAGGPRWAGGCEGGEGLAAMGRKQAWAELWSRSPLFSAIRRIGVNDFSELLLLLMNDLFAIFSEKRAVGLGLKAQFG